MKRIGFMALVAACAVSLFAQTAAAQSISDIEDELRVDHVYVEDGAEGSEAGLRAVVADAADTGMTLYIVSISGSNTDAESLANSLRARLGGTVLVVTPESLGASSAALAESLTNRGLDAFTGTIEEGSAAFVAAVSDQLVAGEGGSGGSDGGGSGLTVLVVLLVIVGLIVVLVIWVRSRNRTRVKHELTVRRTAVTDELGDIGHDILTLADRVTVADNSEATAHFRSGNEQYLELQDQLEAAVSLWAVTEVDYAADTAAWHLDAAEALLDGQPVPAEPSRPDLEVSRQTTSPIESSSQTPVDTSLSSPRVEPRQRRRTQWDPPSTRGGGFGNLLTGILVGDVLRGGGRSRRRAPGHWSGGGSLGGGLGGSSGSRSRGSSGSRRR